MLSSQRKFGVLLVHALAWILAVAWTPAWAQEGERSLEALRANLTAAKTESDWKGYFRKIGKAPDGERPAAYRDVLGPILSGSAPGLTAQPVQIQEALKQFVARSVLEELSEGDAALLHEALVSAMADAPRRQAVRETLANDPDTGRSPGWDRMLVIAHRVLQQNVKLASQCLSILMGEAGGSREIDVLALLWNYRATTGRNLGRPSDDEVLAAYTRILGHGFQDVQAADTWIDTHFGDALRTWTDWHAWDADGQRSAIEAAIRRKVKEANIRQPVMHEDEIGSFVELIVRSIESIDKSRAAELSPFWTAPRERARAWEQPLQRAAIQRAKTLGLEADATGVAALEGLFLRVADPAVVGSAMDIINGWAIQEPTADTRKIAKEMRDRLRERNGDDPIDLRIRLVRFISVLGGVEHLDHVLADARTRVLQAAARQDADLESRVAFYRACIGALAQAKGATVPMLIAHYRHEEALARVPIRDAVVEGLSRKRIREDDTQRSLAAAFLGLVVAGGEVPGADGTPRTVERDPSVDVRLSALRSLRDFPMPGTVSVLAPLAVADGDDDREAKAALDALVRLLTVYEHRDAGIALAKAVAAFADRPDMERYVLGRVQAVAEAVESDALAAAVHAILTRTPPVSDDVYEKAMACAIQLADAASAKVALGTWIEAKTARAKLPALSEEESVKASIAAAQAAVDRVEATLRSLLSAVANRSETLRSAKRRAADDRAVSDVLSEISRREQHDLTLSLLASFGKSASRTPYRLQEAHARAGRARYPTRDNAARSADADAAINLFGAVIGELEDPAERAFANRVYFFTHLLRATDLEDDMLAKGEAYRSALEVAVAAKNDEMIVRKALDEAPRVRAVQTHLPEDLTKGLNDLIAQLEAVAAGGDDG